MSASNLESSYMPSHWSKRSSHEKLLEEYFKFCENVTASSRKNVENQLNVPYGSTDRTKYDIYGTNLQNDAPILLFIHGGYWQEFSKDQSGFMVPNFVEHGIKVIIAGYDLCPSVSLTDIVNQIKLLTEKVLAYAHKLGSRGLWICGHSAGAHLGASLLHDKKWFDSVVKKTYNHLFKGLILIAGIYYLEPLLGVSVNEALRLTSEEIQIFSFTSPKEDQDKINDLTVASDVQVILAVGECDSPIFIQESRNYAMRLTKFLDNVEFVLLRKSIDHFDIVEKLVDRDFILSKKLIQVILGL